MSLSEGLLILRVFDTSCPVLGDNRSTFPDEKKNLPILETVFYEIRVCKGKWRFLICVQNAQLLNK